MGRCFNCGYMYADLNDEGEPILQEYCHYEGPEAWAPCAQDDEYYDDVDPAAEWLEEERQYDEWLNQLEMEEQAAQEAFFNRYE